MRSWRKKAPNLFLDHTENLLKRWEQGYFLHQNLSQLYQQEQHAHFQVEMVQALKHHIEQVLALSIDVGMHSSFVVCTKSFHIDKTTVTMINVILGFLHLGKGISDIILFSQFRKPLEKEVHT